MKETVKNKKTYTAPRVLQVLRLGAAEEVAQGQFIVVSASIGENEYDVRGEREFEEEVDLGIRHRNLWDDTW